MRSVCPVWKTKRKPRLLRRIDHRGNLYYRWSCDSYLTGLRRKKWSIAMERQFKEILDRITWEALTKTNEES